MEHSQIKNQKQNVFQSGRINLNSLSLQKQRPRFELNRLI